MNATPFQSENEHKENPKSFLTKNHLEKFRPLHFRMSATHSKYIGVHIA